jgi:hypothetical protein
MDHGGISLSNYRKEQKIDEDIWFEIFKQLLKTLEFIH